MLASGQPMRIAIESGFSLTQIGEFSFIIATLGMSLGVIDANLYPIVVAVSVITTFFTPYFIKLSDPFSRWVEKKMPKRLALFINGYSKNSTRAETELSGLWKKNRNEEYYQNNALFCYSRGCYICFNQPPIPDYGENNWRKSWQTACNRHNNCFAMSPFLLALCYPSTKHWEREKLQTSIHSNVPFIAFRLVRVLIAIAFIVGFITEIYSHLIAVTIAFAIFVLIAIYFSKSVKKRMKRIESTFINNLNERELRRSGKNNNLVSDMHLAYINIGYNCPFVGQKLRDSNHRTPFLVLTLQAYSVAKRQ